MCSTGDVFVLRKHEIDAAWEQIETLLARIEDPTFSADEVRAQVMSGHALVWGLSQAEKISAVWVTKVEGNNSSKWGVVWLCAGDGLPAMIEAYKTHTERYFREQGCQYVQINGRKGWLKVLDGYRATGVLMVKRL